MIAQFDKTTVAALHIEAAALLKQLGEKYGVEVRAAGGGFDVDKATLKFDFRLTGAEAEKAAFAQYCALFNCKPSDYGRVAVINGKEMALIGFEMSRRSYPVRVRPVKGGQVLLLREDVLQKRFHTGSPDNATAPLTAHPEIKFS